MSPRAHEGSVPAFFPENRVGSLASFGLKKGYCMKNKLQGCYGLMSPRGSVLQASSLTRGHVGRLWCKRWDLMRDCRS